MLNIKDLKKHYFYHINISKRFAIFTFNEIVNNNGIIDSDRVSTIGLSLCNLNNGELELKKTNFWVTGRNLREATTEEACWLLDCIKHDKVILDKKSFNYNINLKEIDLLLNDFNSLL